MLRGKKTGFAATNAPERMPSLRTLAIKASRAFLNGRHFNGRSNNDTTTTAARSAFAAFFLGPNTPYLLLSMLAGSGVGALQVCTGAGAKIDPVVRHVVALHTSGTDKHRPGDPQR